MSAEIHSEDSIVDPKWEVIEMKQKGTQHKQVFERPKLEIHGTVGQKTFDFALISQ
jgi:hypothetical protein